MFAVCHFSYLHLGISFCVVSLVDVIFKEFLLCTYNKCCLCHQNKLLEEEEYEKREEEERRERRKQKEKEKKLRRKEKLKSKEKGNRNNGTPVPINSNGCHTSTILGEWSTIIFYLVCVMCIYADLPSLCISICWYALVCHGR